jgi:hypothetical protein
MPMAKKSKPVNAVKERVRAAPKRKRPSKKATTRTRGAGAKASEPPRRSFDAKQWLGAFPELAGPTLSAQRRMRDEW